MAVTLKDKQRVLGVNERNLIISAYNTKDSKRIADSKLKTKEFFGPRGVAVPQIYAIIKRMEKVENFDFSTLQIPCVVKPNKGFGGKGILVIVDQDSQGRYISKDNKIYTEADLKKHFASIISGYFSISGNRDTVVIEKMIVLDKRIELLGKFGLPDIRVIVFNQIPIMGMMRIPSAKSGGKANLHMGAYAAGIDMGNGTITSIYTGGKRVNTLTGIGDIRGVEIPHWNKILTLASQAQKLTKIPYLGVDIVLDDVEGPLLLELNVRPGLEVQNVNQAALGQRLKKVGDIHVDSVEKGVRLAQDMFGRGTDDHVQKVSSRKILGTREYIHVHSADADFRYIANIDPQITGNKMSSAMLKRLNADIADVSTHKKGNKKYAKLAFYLMEVEIHGVFEVVKDSEPRITLGRNILGKFLVDPTKYEENELPQDASQHIMDSKNVGILKNIKNQTLEVDKKLMAIDRKLNILKYIQPINIDEHKHAFVSKRGDYKFDLEYADLPIDIDELQKDLDKISVPEMPLEDLYVRKQEEIGLKLDFLRAFSNGQDKKVSQISSQLYGELSEDLVHQAYEILDQEVDEKSAHEGEFLSQEEIKEFTKKFFHIYDVDLKIEFPSEMVSRVSVGKKAIKFQKDAQITKKELRSVIAHEIETHYLRRYNGELGDLEILASGTAGYTPTEEGLAISHQNRFLTENMWKYRSMYRLYVAMDFFWHHSFEEGVYFLGNVFQGDYEKMFRVLIRIKRGIREASSDFVNFKDTVYLNGYTQVQQYLEAHESVRDLYIGKIAIEDRDILREAGYQFTEDMKIPLFVV